MAPVLPGDSRFEPGTPGGTLTGAWVGPCCVGIDSMNAFENSDGSHNFTHLIYEHLLTFAVLPTTVSTNPFSGQYSELVPALAKSWEVSSDQLTWTFHLQEGVNWHDGGDFTSDDVKFTFETCLNPQAGVCAGGANLATIVGAQAVQDGTTTELEGVQAPDPLTVTITTTSPNALLPQFVMNLFIMSKAALGQVPIEQISKTDYWYTPGKAVGTGPFKLTRLHVGPVDDPVPKRRLLAEPAVPGHRSSGATSRTPRRRCSRSRQVRSTTPTSPRTKSPERSRSPTRRCCPDRPAST